MQRDTSERSTPTDKPSTTLIERKATDPPPAGSETSEVMGTEPPEAAKRALGEAAIDAYGKTTIESVDIKGQVEIYKAEIDTAIQQAAEELLREYRGVYLNDSAAFEVIQAYCEVLTHGGKRIRGALVKNSFEMFGGEDEAIASELAVIMEMVQAYILALDDICDNSKERRGVPTVHEAVKQGHSARQLVGDSDHYGKSMAALVIDIIKQRTQHMVLNLPIEAETRIKLADELSIALELTGRGQISDMANSAKREAPTEEQVLDMYHWKTSEYTFFLPMWFGAIAAGATHEDRELLYRYSESAGIAFQLVDDMGLFSTKDALGKPPEDDIKEGKRTIQVLRALAKATPEEAKFLRSCLGKQELSSEEFEACKQIIKHSGGFDDAKEMAIEYSAMAVQALAAAPRSWNKKGLAFLRGLPAYLMKRIK